MNLHLNRVIGFDESGFAGSSDEVIDAKLGFMAFPGGGLYNGLDYSFFAVRMMALA